MRQKVIAHYLGQGIAADALSAAFRIPNLLQNLLGEGVLSAAFIPEYARLRLAGDETGARRLAGAVLGLLSLAAAFGVAVGVGLTPWLVDLLVPGFSGQRRTLAIGLVRILFPGVGLLVLSAWCLGVLNAHRRFFLSYAAPVVWNLAIIGATIAAAAAGDGSPVPEVVVGWTAWGAVLGSALQFVIQLPAIRRAAGPIRPTLDRRAPAVAAVIRNVGPASLARGVAQISAFLDTWIASWLPIGAVAALTNAQLLYLLPISLFGMSVAAAELPAMAETAAGEEAPVRLLERIREGSRRVAFFVIPAMALFLVLGGPVVRLVFQSGAFTAADARWVWATLAAATVGLVPQAWGRLLNSAHYALGDTRGPLRFAATRVVAAVSLGALLALLGPDLLGVDPKWGTAGLTLGGALAAILEWGLLRRSLAARLGTRLPHAADWRPWASAAIASGLGWVAATSLPSGWLADVASVMVFGVSYLTAAWLLKAPELVALAARFRS